MRRTSLYKAVAGSASSSTTKTLIRSTVRSTQARIPAAPAVILCLVLGFGPSQPASALKLAEVEIEGGASLVAQRINSAGAENADSPTTSLGFRADIGADIPLPPIGSTVNKLVAHVRLGQGDGLATQPTHTGAVNSIAFDTGESGSDAAAILAQLYYQLEVGADTPNRFALSIGKLDPFGFFDQNAVADDESQAFVNNVFLHNPMLDSGGDIGGDEFGFAPGLVASWARHDDAGPRVGLDAGFFAAGDGADFSGSPTRPVSLLQLSFSTRDAQRNATGTWRLYGWYNPQAGDAGSEAPAHAGWGISFDQALFVHTTAFGRLGKRSRGTGAFDSAITLGVEINGSAWSRQSDALGLALGQLNTSSSITAPDDEQNMEVFYRVALNDSLTVTPHWQLVKNPAGEAQADDIRVFGVRASLSF